MILCDKCLRTAVVSDVLFRIFFFYVGCLRMFLPGTRYDFMSNV